MKVCYLSSSGFGMLFLDLYLDHVAWMLDDLGDEGLVSATNLSEHPLNQIHKSTIHPILPENSSSRAEGCNVRLDHAKCPMDRPKDEKDDEQVMGEPEALVVLPLEPLE